MSNPLGGQVDLSTQQDRVILYSKELAAYGRGVLDSILAFDGSQATGYTASLQPGVVMARITASKLWCPCIRTQVTPAGGTTSQNVPVNDARHFQAGMKITVGGDTGLTIASVNYGTNVITVSDAAFLFANDEPVFATTFPDGTTSCAGAEIARSILDEYVDAYDKDLRANRKMGLSKLLYSGVVVKSQLLADIAAILAVTNFLDNIIFDDDIGQDA